MIMAKKGQDSRVFLYKHSVQTVVPTVSQFNDLVVDIVNPSLNDVYRSYLTGQLPQVLKSAC
jgi:hypothetical protein